MTVLQAIAQACPFIGLTVPDQVFASTEREHVELAALSIEIADRIKEEHDWNKLKVIKTMTGDGVTTAFALPTDYDRMLKEGELFSNTRKDEPLTHIQDSNTWLADIVSGHIPENPQWTIYGDQLHINPAPETGEVVSYWYIKTLPEFTSNDDTFLIGERLLTRGIIWQWKAHKGQPYAEDLQTYEIKLTLAVDKDKGASAFATGLQRYRPNDQFVTSKELTP